MPTKVTGTEKYWTWCYKKIWGIRIAYPCRKRRNVTKWRYEFSVVHENCKFFYAKLYGCEGGKEYTWSAG